jgi:4-amino-4-deoxy-L-arabinose transferase-like glycosyltransferase
MKKPFHIHQLILILAIIRFVLPYLLQDPFYQAHRDEYLYLAEGHHLAWGFMEVPPMMSVLAWTINALGGGFFWIKFWPSLFGSFTFILTARMAVSLGGRAFSVILSFLPFVFTGYLRLFYLFHPNFLDVFFWTLMAYSLFHYVRTKNNRWLYLFGIAAGLGMLSKYSAAFYIVSLLIGFILTRERKIFLNRHFYYASLLGLIIFFPNILWQYNHRFPIVTHMTELQDEQLKLIDPVNFIISQFLMFLPCVYIWLSGLIWVLFSRSSATSYRLFGWAYFSVIILLLILHGKDYYAAGAYPVLFSFGSYALENLSISSRRWARYAMITVSVLTGLLVMPIIMAIAKPPALARYYKAVHAVKSGALRWEDQKDHPLPQDFADYVGWKETAMKAGAVYRSLPPLDRARTIVYCRGYYFAGALNYYRSDAGLPEVYSDNASFLFWMPSTYHVKNLILIAHQIPDKDDIVFQQFERMSIKDSLNDPLARENGIKVILYENANNKVDSLIEKGIAEKKKEYSR